MECPVRSFSKSLGRRDTQAWEESAKQQQKYKQKGNIEKSWELTGSLGRIKKGLRSTLERTWQLEWRPEEPAGNIAA